MNTDPYRAKKSLDGNETSKPLPIKADNKQQATISQRDGNHGGYLRPETIYSGAFARVHLIYVGRLHSAPDFAMYNPRNGAELGVRLRARVHRDPGLSSGLTRAQQQSSWWTTTR